MTAGWTGGGQALIPLTASETRSSTHAATSSSVGCAEGKRFSRQRLPLPRQSASGSREFYE